MSLVRAVLDLSGRGWRGVVMTPRASPRSNGSAAAASNAAAALKEVTQR